MSYDVFLSYARADTERAVVIKDLLEGLGLTVFFDTEGLDGGDVFPDVLDRAVKSASAVVGIWTAHALTRPWVKIECDIGRARGVLVPIQVEHIADLDRPAAFWNIQFSDLSEFDGDTEHAGWLRFIRSLARTLDRPDLLERESAAQAAEPETDDADVRAELEALRSEMTKLRDAKAALASASPPTTTDQTATNLALWQEIKDSENPAAMRRFLETVRDTPLEHVVDARLESLERAEPQRSLESVTGLIEDLQPGRYDEPAAPEAPKTNSKVPWIVAGLFAIAAVAAGGYYLGQPAGAPLETGMDQESADTSGTQSGSTPTRSVAYHEKACADGVSTACMSAATAYAYGEDGAEKDQYVAMSYYDMGCNLGDMEACWVAGVSAEQSEDFNTAQTYYDKACRGGAEDGCELLNALEQMQAAEAADQAYTDAVVRLQQALIDKGFLNGAADGAPGPATKNAVDRFRTEASNDGARPVFDGTDTRQITRQAEAVEDWTEPAPASTAPQPSWAIGHDDADNQIRATNCFAGDMTSCNNLGYSYAHARGVTRDYSEANRLFSKACDDGNMPGCNNLGYSYATARGVTRDYAEANRLYRKACDAENMPSCSNLGNSYAKALGITRDYSEANRLYRKACDGGNMPGCNNLGYSYATARGVTRDYAEANRLYSKACDAGNMPSCSNLGDSYAKALGVTKDNSEAKRLYAKACDGGNEIACSNLNNLSAD